MKTVTLVVEIDIDGDHKFSKQAEAHIREAANSFRDDLACYGDARLTKLTIQRMPPSAASGDAEI